MSLSLFGLIFLLLHPAITSMNLRDPKTVVKKEENRPPMYTFFQMKLRRDGALDSGGKHEEMLEAWSKAWYDRGWEPIVLNLEDAKKHPDFEHYSSRFENLTPDEAFIFGGSYNYMCLMRWLAIAAQRTDAFMSDYDTFPMHIKANDGHYLPNGGKFTVYERVVPSLMSASASEWDSLAKQVIENVLDKFEKEGTQGVYSDMYALEDVYKRSPNHAKAYIAERRVDSYPYISLHKMDCERTDNVLALHLSHAYTGRARDAGLIPESISDNDRYLYSQMIMKDWKEQCSQQEDASNLRA